MKSVFRLPRCRIRRFLHAVGKCSRNVVIGDAFGDVFGTKTAVYEITDDRNCYVFTRIITHDAAKSADR